MFILVVKSSAENVCLLQNVGLLQSIANQVQFIAVRRQIEKGMYFWSLNQVLFNFTQVVDVKRPQRPVISSLGHGTCLLWGSHWKRVHVINTMPLLKFSPCSFPSSNFVCVMLISSEIRKVLNWKTKQRRKQATLRHYYYFYFNASVFITQLMVCVLDLLRLFSTG